MESEIHSENLLRAAFVWLADNEYGNPLMNRVAEEFLCDHPEVDVVEVIEHAGWWMRYARLNGRVVVIGSANDQAVYPDEVQELRREYGARPVHAVHFVRRGTT